MRLVLYEARPKTTPAAAAVFHDPREYEGPRYVLTLEVELKISFKLELKTP